MKDFDKIAENESVMNLISHLQNSICLECPLDWACDERGVTCAAFDFVLNIVLESLEIRLALANATDEDILDWL